MIHADDPVQGLKPAYFLHCPSEAYRMKTSQVSILSGLAFHFGTSRRLYCFSINTGCIVRNTLPQVLKFYAHGRLNRAVAFYIEGKPMDSQFCRG